MSDLPLKSEPIKKLLLITGKDAFRDIKKLDWEKVRKKYKITIIKADIVTAAFMSKRDLAECLSPYNEDDFDLVLVSGLVSWDISNISHPLKKKVKKGPRFLVSLIEILLTFDLNNLSSTIPADDLYLRNIRANYEEEVAAIKTEMTLSRSSAFFRLSSSHNQILFSPNLPAVLLGEIVDFPKLSWEQICWKVEDYIQKGVDIIDLGCIAGVNYQEYISDQISKLKRRYKVAFSIDSLDEEEIAAAVKAGVEMVLSITIDNIQKIMYIPKNMPVVVIPYSKKDQGKALSDRKVIARLISLWEMLDKEGYKKILLDPILKSPISPGLLDSLLLARKLRRKIDNLKQRSDGTPFSSKPQMLLGIGNVSELLDADSPGINGIMAMIAAELGVTAVLSTEASIKTQCCLKELSESLKLAFYAKNQNLPPINLGITALKFKTKLPYPQYNSFDERIKKVNSEQRMAIMDPKGYFKIFLDMDKQRIMVTHFKNNNSELEATRSFSGTDAESLYKAILESKLVSRLDHAAYLGKELGTAESALKFGTGYSQK